MCDFAVNRDARHEQRDIVVQAWLGLERKDVTGFLVDKGPGDLALAADGLDADDCALVPSQNGRNRRRSSSFFSPTGIHDGLSTRQHREQAKQQNFIDGIDHLAALPRIRKIFKMIK